MAEELHPPPNPPGRNDQIYARRSILKVCAVGDAALVVVEYQPRNVEPQLEAWDRYANAFNLDLRTKKYSPIHLTIANDVWKFAAIAQFEPGPPDVVFTSYSCTECESTREISSYRYDPGTESWGMRDFSDEIDPWWATGSAIVFDSYLIGETDTISFDCVYGVGRYSGGAQDDLFARCREGSVGSDNRVKFVDDSFLFTWYDGKFRRIRMTGDAEIAKFTAKACETMEGARICTLPKNLATSESLAAAERVRKQHPAAPETQRYEDPFREIEADTPFEKVIAAVGVPDEIFGRGTVSYKYYLGDGCLVIIRGTFSAKSAEIVAPDGTILGLF